ncbi:MAG: phage portal protein [Planctomycetota bacterium]|nr:phage portal protein [Planctomycetota bacterium]
MNPALRYTDPSTSPHAALGPGEAPDPALADAALLAAIEAHRRTELPRLRRLWNYYRNPMTPTRDARGYRLGQESGLPARILAGAAWGGVSRGVVVENDIGWRVQTMVDFLLGKPVRIVSTAPQEDRRALLDQVLDLVWERSGGIALLQDMALLGQVYGHVDLVLRVDHDAVRLARGEPRARALRAAEGLRIEVVDPCRGVPVFANAPISSASLAPDAYAILAPAPAEARAGLAADGRYAPAAGPDVAEVLTADARRVYEGGRLVWEREWSWSGERPPVVHIQNISDPTSYSGLGEVEPLIPLQDELNTRLCDRAHRVTMQSFRMYLAKGVDGFDKAPIAPGQVWMTDNPEASITAFGGDAPTPGEEAHIRELREALDKASGVPPLAGGVVQGRIGNLSSANALRVTLMGVLAKTARKRVTYGAGMARMCALVLEALDAGGALATGADERGVRLSWPDPLPEDTQELVQIAKGKRELGVPAERVLEELGYAPTDEGVA